MAQSSDIHWGKSALRFVKKAVVLGASVAAVILSADVLITGDIGDFSADEWPASPTESLADVNDNAVPFFASYIGFFSDLIANSLSWCSDQIVAAWDYVRNEGIKSTEWGAAFYANDGAGSEISDAMNKIFGEDHSQYVTATAGLLAGTAGARSVWRDRVGGSKAPQQSGKTHEMQEIARRVQALRAARGVQS